MIARLEHVAPPARATVDPTAVDVERVFHYSIPVLDQTGDGAYEDPRSIGSSKTLLRGGEILISKLNPRKPRIVRARVLDVPVLCSGEFVVLRPIDIDARYLEYVLRSEDTRQYLDSRVQSVTRSQQRVRPEDITKMPLELPDGNAQRRIADFLDAETARIDGLIQRRRRTIELLETRITAGIDAALRVDAPDCRLKHLCRKPLQYGANAAAEYEDPTWPRYIRTTDIDELGNLRSETFRSLPLDVARPYILHDGDVLFTRSGATVGKSFMYRSEWGTACYAGYLIRASLDQELVDPRYVAYFARSTLYWNQVAESTIQATIQNVSAERYGDMTLPVPLRSEQERIADSLDALSSSHRKLVGRCGAQIDLLNELRQALITAAVTGELDLAKATA